MVRLSLFRMMAAQAKGFSFRQEMPPPNGYPPISVDRAFAYRFYGSKFVLIFGCNLIAIYVMISSRLPPLHLRIWINPLGYL